MTPLIITIKILIRSSTDWDCLIKLATNDETMGGYKNKAVIGNYYMAVSQKDWKQPNRRIWLAKIDIDRGLDFPI